MHCLGSEKCLKGKSERQKGWAWKCLAGWAITAVQLLQTRRDDVTISSPSHILLTRDFTSRHSFLHPHDPNDDSVPLASQAGLNSIAQETAIIIYTCTANLPSTL